MPQLTRNKQKGEATICSFTSVTFYVVNHRASQVETLFDVLEDIDPKLKALGVVEINGNMVYIADDEGAGRV